LDALTRQQLDSEYGNTKSGDATDYISEIEPDDGGCNGDKDSCQDRDVVLISATVEGIDTRLQFLVCGFVEIVFTSYPFDLFG